MVVCCPEVYFSDKLQTLVYDVLPSTTAVGQNRTLDNVTPAVRKSTFLNGSEQILDSVTPAVKTCSFLSVRIGLHMVTCYPEVYLSELVRKGL